MILKIYKIFIVCWIQVILFKFEEHVIHVANRERYNQNIILWEKYLSKIVIKFFLNNYHLGASVLRLWYKGFRLNLGKSGEMNISKSHLITFKMNNISRGSWNYVINWLGPKIKLNLCSLDYYGIYKLQNIVIEYGPVFTLFTF